MDDVLAAGPALPLAAALLTGAVAAGEASLFWLVGRDRQSGGDGSGEERVPLRRGAPAVAEAPPAAVTAAEAGVLLDERVRARHVSAAIVALGVRGYLRVEEDEQPRTLLRRGSEWWLVRTRPPDEWLEPFEAALMEGLFADGNATHLSVLHGRFMAPMRDVRDALYAATVRRGWYRRSPAATRRWWSLGGLALVLGGVVAFWLAAAYTQAAVLTLPAILAGAGLVAGSRLMPARTAAGTEVLRGVRAFERRLAGDLDACRFETLAHAVVLRQTAACARACATAEGPPAWFRLAQPAGGDAFAPDAFARALERFVAHSARALSTRNVARHSSAAGGADDGTTASSGW